ncbi:DNA polymerase II [Corallincola spongiicola]|uniref:DNA polymerase n=1 Tax=Corallincola spongiicola TaxID=2520508 RepID=A0ABY1WMK3_9GAMM|nr:DNA polymerase II [Corallincola spongiicola]TAA43644.1 DNA polymerase II [Corallincola spongiicola]
MLLTHSSTVHTGFLLSRHSRDTASGTQIVLWLTSEQGPVKLVIENQQPLFFIATQYRAMAEASLSRAKLTYQCKDLPLSLFDHSPVSVFYFTAINSHFRAQDLLREQQIELFEADFRLHDRYLMERFAKGGLQFIGQPSQRQGYIEYQQAKIKPAEYLPEFKVLSLDIECSLQGELYSIGMHIPASEQQAEIATVIMRGKPQPASTAITWVDGERELLQALEQAMQQLDPDIVIGWNVVNFDFRLLLKRAEKHQLKLRLGRGNSYASWRDSRTENNQGFITLPGRVVIDGIDGLKTATYSFDSFSLEAVAQTLLGKGKLADNVADRMAEIDHNFHHDKPALAAYNLEDCRLVSEIFEHTQLLDFLRLRSQLTGLELDRIGGSVAAFTNVYLPKLHRAGYVAPNLPADGGLASPGGYVMDSRPGLYKHVLVLDFKSLYPSIIRTFKIDPMGLIEGLKTPQSAIPGFREALFSRDKHFLPSIINELWLQRDEAKKVKDAPRSQAIKILMNSFYGVLGSGGCRFYDPRLASSITLRGHEIMQQTARWIAEHGYEVIYGDTDSTFVWLNGDFNSNQADSIGQQLAEDINLRWRQKLQQELQLDCHLEIEYETHYRRFLMPTIRGSEAGSKKRYAGLIGEGASEKLIFKGLETVRTDWTELAKQFQTQLYQMVFHDQDPSDFIQQTVNETLAGQRDALLVYKKRLRRKLSHYVKNVPPHVRAARIADERNLAEGKPQQYQHKGSISYLITLNGPEPVEHLTSPIDYDHYIDRQLKPVADAILPFIKLDFDRLIDNQLGLF